MLPTVHRMPLIASIIQSVMKKGTPNSATLCITVTGEEDPPDAEDDSEIVDIDSTVSGVPSSHGARGRKVLWCLKPRRPTHVPNPMEKISIVN